MELAAQPICMNAYFFRGRFVLHLQTGNVNRSAISSGAFAVFPLEIHWIQSWNTPPCLWNSKLRYPPTSSEFQSKKPPPLSRNSKMLPVVWYGYFLESPNPILDLREGQVKFLEKFKLKKNCNQGCSSKIFWGLLKRLCNNLPEWQAIKPTFFAPWFWYKVFVHWNLKLFNFLVDSVWT